MPVVRFKNPTDGVVAWDDLVKGRIEFANGELDDLIIARADGTPTYNFCVVVDDWDMGITHVIRGDDHVNNTPRQINILQALGAAVPQYAHLSMILGDDGAASCPSAMARCQRDAVRRGRLSAGGGASTTWRGSAGRTATRKCSRASSLSNGSTSTTSRLGRPVQHRETALAQPALHQADAGCTTLGASWSRPRLDARGIDTDSGPDLENVVALLQGRAAIR